MDGFYDHCPKEFTSFTDQAAQIESYVKEHYNGHLDGLYGASQGGVMLVELLTRGNIDVDIAVMDGVYVAHQGKLAAYCSY